jgi:hypothetical protein
LAATTDQFARTFDLTVFVDAVAGRDGFEAPGVVQVSVRSGSPRDRLTGSR